MTTTPPPGTSAAEEEAVEICRNLIRIDTSNFGDNSGPGEREAATYVADLLSEVGLEPQVFESAPKRTSVVARMDGKDPQRPALVVHGHTDVVPAQADDWSVDPFAAIEKDGCIWGRGAVDMKNMDAMILAAVREMVRAGRQPDRDLVIAFFADEEHGGRYGSHWMVDNHPELFAGASEAISEVGGYSVDIAGQRTYLLQTAEKGIAWLRLIAEGRTGHGSQINTENAVARLADSIARIGQYEWPRRIIPAVDGLLRGISELVDKPYDPEDPQIVEALIAELGTTARFVGATIATTTNPTMLDAGYKANVIPGSAEAVIDMRVLPGDEGESIKTIETLLAPGVRWEYVQEDVPLEAPFEGPLVDLMVESLQREDPEAHVLPYALSGGTDNKALSRLGITGYGFSPLQLPGDLDFAAMFHGIDERVPISSLKFGTRVLRYFLPRA